MEEINYINRVFQEPDQSYFLFGPRGTGKSTWLKKNHSKYLLIDLLEVEIYREYKARPEKLKYLIEGNPDKNCIIIDEVQKVPEILSVVHSLMESKRSLKFILTGSSSTKLKRQGVDLLAGRAIMKSFHPFLACELDQRFELDEALNRGLVPVVYSSTNPDQALKTYTSLYLKEEVQLEGLVRNIGDFARFLESISFSHGSVLNISEVARDCHVKRETVQGYLSVLQDLLIAYTIPVFARRAKRIMVNHPKFYYFDSGVFRSLRPAGPLDQPGAIEAAALEGLVAQHLRAWIDYSDYSCILYYWRTKGGSEIDFIVYGEEVFWAVEVKNSNRIRNADLRSLKSFKTDYPEAKLFFVYRGEERLMIDGILCIPCTDFLLSLIPGKELTTKNTKNTKRGL